MRVGFIGAGRMGRPMVARLAAAGHDVRALARRPETRRDLERLGVGPVDAVAQTGTGADVVVVCVFDDDQVREVCYDSDLLSSIPAGAALVVHTTVDPRTVEAIAARAPGIAVVDAAVSGGPHDVAAGRLTLFVGGSDQAVSRVQPVLSCYGDPVLHLGPVGTGQKAKLLNNALFAGQLGLLAEAVRLGRRLGVPEPALLAALPHGSAASRVLDLVAARESVESFVEMTGEFLRKDVAVVRRITEQLGIDPGVLDAAAKAIDC